MDSQSVRVTALESTGSARKYDAALNRSSPPQQARVSAAPRGSRRPPLGRALEREKPRFSRRVKAVVRPRCTAAFAARRELHGGRARHRARRRPAGETSDTREPLPGAPHGRRAPAATRGAPGPRAPGAAPTPRPAAPLAHGSIFAGAAHALVVGFRRGGRADGGGPPHASGHGRGGSGVRRPPGAWKQGRRPPGEGASLGRAGRRGRAPRAERARLSDGPTAAAPAAPARVSSLRRSHWARPSPPRPAEVLIGQLFCPRPHKPEVGRKGERKLKLTQESTAMLSGNCSLRRRWEDAGCPVAAGSRGSTAVINSGRKSRRAPSAGAEGRGSCWRAQVSV